MPELKDYQDIAPRGLVDVIYKLARPLKGKTMLHINSTKSGGGVAEILHRLLPLFEDLGLKTRWEVIKGDDRFFQITKSIHNGLQGMDIMLSEADFQYYLEVSKKFSRTIDLAADLVVVHDPQPLLLIQFRSHCPWLWRCHIDLSAPNFYIWRKLTPFVSAYDGCIISMPGFSQKLAIPEYVIPPSIDPLSPKNCELEMEEIKAVLRQLNIADDKPIVLQVSRFDWFKDPLGVVDAYKMVRSYEDCQLVLVGGPASDDPEAQTVFDLVKSKANTMDDVHVLMLPPDSHREINALQRSAAVVVQKSIKEGFGLTVSEALWKEKPTVGGFAGGIPQQIIFGITGYTVHSVEGCAYRIRQILANPEFGKKLGRQGKELVRNRFLITRHLCDYLALMHKYCGQ